MTKWEAITRISLWQDGKWCKDYLSEMMISCGAKNLRDIALDDVMRYYERERGEHECDERTQGDMESD